MAKIETKLKQILQDIALKEDYKLSHIDLQPITSGGANYTTDLYLATISESLKPDIHLFIKVANIDEEGRAINNVVVRVYEIESFFYTKLAVDFERIYNKNSVQAEDRLIIPKYYADDLTPLEETLILENLEAKGFKSYDRMKTFSWEYASTAVTLLAKFHALGMAIRDENPAEFEKLDKTFFIPNFQELMQQFMHQAIQAGCAALNDDHKQRVQKFAANNDLMETIGRFMNDKTVVMHGDFKPSNLMHRRRNGKLELIPLDFQTLRMGNPVGDLIQFIFSGSDEEFRRLHYQRLLDHYFTQLTLALQKLRIDVEKMYPRKAFDADEIELRPIGLLLSLSMIGVLTVAPEDAPRFNGDLSSIQVKPNQLAQERLTGIVKDYIRWGVL